ncbi:MAG: hypothetical protein J6Q44_00600, partial [Alphaproteobacteria bacterium]|nr:hypothetical protein [Alphaproteobacteria bacterium]
MRKIAILSMLIAGILGDAVGATRPTGRAGVRGGTSTTTTTAQKTTAARAATNSRTAPRAAAPAATGAQTVNRGRAATTTATKPVVAARAGTTQKVIGTGTKVATATKNVVVSEECQQKYDGCMDSFCMLDNETGGRCLCSDKNAELDSILAEIEKLDQQSYQMATFGVEKIEMGDDADAAIAKANAAAQSVVAKDEESTKKARRTLDLSLWDTAVDFEEEDIFGASAMSPIEGKEGDALHRAAAELCVAQIPECSSDVQLLQMMYAQRIKSDCTAYENSLKQQKNSSTQKLAAAEKALREAALDQLRTANKYDLGQCTVEFKKCMQTTGGCGDDFSGCASMVAMDSTSTRQSTSKKSKNYQIKGAVTTIEISASTYDALVAKKPLCESVTKSCVNVASQVWDTFLREVAPQVKNAELIAEDKARQDCVGNISSCFQKACKDTMDPNDPDGSYDMCLSRPGTMLNVCKIPLNACGIDASSETAAEKSNIWDFVVARLASMRVDSCTTEIKECLQSDDRCGKDYTQCIGLDTDTLKEMCPLEKLIACQTKDENGNYNAQWSQFENIVQGIWLTIDNATLEQCQNIVNERMLELCGDTTTCMAFDDDNTIGTESLVSYQENNGNYVIEGLISFGNVKVEKAQSTDNDVKFGQYEININDYKNHLNDTDPTTARVVSALQSTANKINQKIAILSQDPQIKMCVEGRDLRQINGREEKATARFPYLLDSSILAIISSGLDRANMNYTEKYNNLLGEALEAKDDAIKSTLCAAMASNEKPQCTTYQTVNGEAICTQYTANTFENVFSDEGTKGMSGDDIYSTKYTISGAKLSDLAAVQQKGHAEFTQTDSKGNMIGKIAL